MARRPFIANLALCNLLWAMKQVLGQDGLAAMLKTVGHTEYLGDYPPPDIQEEVGFGDYAVLHKAVADYYGTGARSVLNRVGCAVFNREFTAQVSFGIQVRRRLLPKRACLGFTLEAVARMWTNDQRLPTSVARSAGGFIFTLEKIPVAWGRSVKALIAHTHTGYLEQAGLWATGAPVEIQSVACALTQCRYRVTLSSS
jgi:hypothetical protein